MDSVDARIVADLRAQLAADPRLPYVDEIAVDVFEGDVTLRGTVASFAQRRAAVADARRTRGVAGVFDDLQVRLLSDDRREDAEIRGAALQQLAWDPEIPGDLLDVDVRDGWVTLSGDVGHQYQSDAAFEHVARLYGVIGVTNAITVLQVR